MGRIRAANHSVDLNWGAPVARPVTARSARTTAKNKVVESTAFEQVLDRILVNRLRPLRAEMTAARKSYEAQVALRMEAEARADRLEGEAERLRTRVGELEQELAASRTPTELPQQRRTWFRRRSVEPQQA